MWQDAKLLNSTANFLFGLVCVSILASGVWWLIHRPLFLLETIRVEGSEKTGLHHVNGLSIRDQALPKIQGNFFTANVDEVRLAFESVPWVRNARVQREWPNKLRVVLEEYRVLGTWGDNGKLISLNGDVFTANLAEAEEDAELVYLNGPDGSEKEVLAQYWQLKEWFSQIGLAPEFVNYSNRYAWSVKLNNGLHVELGRVPDQATLKKRVDQLIKIYPQLVNRLQESIVSVDMRYPNGLALKSTHSSTGLDGKLNSKRK